MASEGGLDVHGQPPHPERRDLRAASVGLSKWGLVQGWLAAHLGRRVEVRASSNGLVVSVHEPGLGTEAMEVGGFEDPSATTWRAIVALDRKRA